MWNKRGFTLIELMVVATVLSIGIIGAMNSIRQVFIYARLLSSRLTAAYLAQEGIEIVRNIRDTNWVESSSWDDGITTGDFEADYNDPGLSFYGNRYLRVDGGFYNYGLGEETKFKRKINIQKDTDEISVSVIVMWQERGKGYEVEVFEKLYKWR